MRLRRLSTRWIHYEPFWCNLTRQGVRVTVLDAPFSLPSRLERGVEIMNWGSHDLIGPYESNHPKLAREIRRRFGKHPMGYEIPVDKNPTQLEQIPKTLVTGARLKAELSCWLMERTEWDFFLTVFGECHRGGHTLWSDDSLLDVYQAVDQAVSQVLDVVDLNSTTVIVFSLHGMAANLSQEHFVRPVIDRINAGFGQEGKRPLTTGRKDRGLIRKLRASVPGHLQNTLALSVPVAVRDRVVNREVFGGLVWDKTPGFALRADLAGYLRFNLVGREAKGVLEKGSELYQCYENWLKENFFALKVAGTDAPLVKEILSSTELYPGPRSNYLPDLVILWEPQAPVTEIYSDCLGRVAVRPATGRKGNHRPDGFAVVAGNQHPMRQMPFLRHTADFAGFVRSLLI
jgi:predicted AlkP superfamily phosphohydrolase/phosphomutase